VPPPAESKVTPPDYGAPTPGALPTDAPITPTTPANTNTNTNTNTPANVSAGNEPVEFVRVESVPAEETVLFESKIVKKLSFLVPAQSKITESGTPRSFTITIDASHAVGSTIKKEIYTMRIRRDVDQCQDILYSFAIDPSLGVDYRIIHSQKQSALKNTYRVIQAHEEFGTYAGNMGIRTVACVQSELPAKIEIQSNGFKRNEINDGFTVMGAMIDSLEI
jgi:hypothetical protein